MTCLQNPEKILCMILNLCTLAYVTYQDIRSLSSLDDQTVIAIKAPPETRLEVPDPTEVMLVLYVCVCRSFLRVPYYIAILLNMKKYARFVTVL